MTKLRHNPEVSDDVKALNPDLFQSTPNPAGLTPAQKAWRTQNQVDYEGLDKTLHLTEHQRKAHIIRAHLQHLRRAWINDLAVRNWEEVTGSPVLMQHTMGLIECMLDRIEEECDE